MRNSRRARARAGGLAQAVPTSPPKATAAQETPITSSRLCLMLLSGHPTDVDLADDAAIPEHEDGSEAEVGPGEAYVIEPAHDAWVVGDERFVAFESESRAAEEYARG